MSKHAPGVICRVKPPRPPAIPKWEYDQTNEQIVVLGEPTYTDGGLKGWVIKPELKVVRELGEGIKAITQIYAAAESVLVPIDPGDGQDEILRIAGLPVKETA